MKRRLVKGILALLAFIPLVGCWNAQEIEKRTIVVSMAIDRNESGELTVSIQVPNPRQIAGGGGEGGGGGGGGGAVEVYSGSGPTLEAAFEELSRKSIYPMFLGHMQTLIFSEEMAKQGIAPILDFLRRDPEIRRHMYPIVVSGNAEDALTVQPKLEQIPTYYVRNFIESQVDLERVYDMTLGKVFVDLSHPGKQVPLFYYFKATKDGFKYNGMAVFHGDKMIGALDPAEMNIVLNVREKKAGRRVIAACPGGKIVFRPHKVKRRFTITNQPKAMIAIKVEGEVLENSCNFTIKDERALEKVNKIVASQYEQIAREVTARAQRELKTDVFQIRNHVHSYYPQIWKRVNWETAFPHMPIQVKYDVNVKRIGLKAQ